LRTGQKAEYISPIFQRKITKNLIKIIHWRQFNSHYHFECCSLTNSRMEFYLIKSRMNEINGELKEVM
jgi:deoxyribodipyrimidine photolyase